MAAFAKKDPALALDPAENSRGPSGTARDELLRRIWFTLGALLVYRLGTCIPVPSLDPGFTFQSLLNPWPRYTGNDEDLGYPLSWMSVFGLGLAPYFAALVLARVAAIVWPRSYSDTGAKSGQNTRILTLVLAVLMALAYDPSRMPAVDPGVVFKITTVIALTGGAMFLMWLGEQITRRGIGHGPSLIVATGIVAGLPDGVSGLSELYRTEAIAPGEVLVLLAMIPATIGVVVFFERARRRVLTNCPRQSQGHDVWDLPLKLNGAGFLPPFLALSVLYFSHPAGPQFVYAFIGESEVFYDILRAFDPSRWSGLLLNALLIAFLSFLFRTATHDPREEARKLADADGFIPGVRPGDKTARHLEYVQNRLATIGAAYLIIVCLGPAAFDVVRGAWIFQHCSGLVIVTIVVSDLIVGLQRAVQSPRSSAR